MLALKSDAVDVAIDPWLGGSILAFRWRGIDIFRPHLGGINPLGFASFPLVPFCNRIAQGQISRAGQPHMLPVAPGGIEPNHALHGIGWVSPWAVAEASDEAATLMLRHDGALWPWAFEASQRIRLTANGYAHAMTVTNRDSGSMPAGLGMHPYFPRAGASLELSAKGRWPIGPDRLPTQHQTLEATPDWFAGEGFDDCFTGCDHPVRIRWPSHTLSITSSAGAPFVHVYMPPGEDFFCVEPVSHIPDAVNSALGAGTTGLATLAPGESLTIECEFALEEAG